MPIDTLPLPNNPRSRLLTMLYRTMLMLLVVVSMILVVIGTIQIFQVSQYLKEQQAVELHYLHCISQIPPGQRTPANTNSCFTLPSDLQKKVLQY